MDAQRPLLGDLFKKKGHWSRASVSILSANSALGMRLAFARE
jgi:hypothetical protein